MGLPIRFLDVCARFGPEFFLTKRGAITYGGGLWNIGPTLDQETRDPKSSFPPFFYLVYILYINSRIARASGLSTDNSFPTLPFINYHWRRQRRKFD